VARGGVFNAAEVERLKHEHLSGARKHSKLLFSLLMFHLWQAASQRTQRVDPAASRKATFAA
jgi:hypothetical protein